MLTSDKSLYDDINVLRCMGMWKYIGLQIINNKSTYVYFIENKLLPVHIDEIADDMEIRKINTCVIKFNGRVGTQASKYHFNDIEFIAWRVSKKRDLNIEIYKPSKKRYEEER